MRALVIKGDEEVVEQISVCLKLSWSQVDIITSDQDFLFGAGHYILAVIY